MSVNPIVDRQRFHQTAILTGRMKDAQQKASDEYDIFNKTQKITSDFDKQIKHMLDDPK